VSKQSIPHWALLNQPTNCMSAASFWKLNYYCKISVTQTTFSQ